MWLSICWWLKKHPSNDGQFIGSPHFMTKTFLLLGAAGWEVRKNEDSGDLHLAETSSAGLFHFVPSVRTTLAQSSIGMENGICTPGLMYTVWCMICFPSKEKSARKFPSLLQSTLRKNPVFWTLGRVWFFFSLLLGQHVGVRSLLY